jgi:ribonuclease HI
MVFYDSGGSGDCKEEVWAGWKYLDSTVKTNNVAEYTALIEGLKVAKDKGMQKLRIYGDSKIVICQITGEFKVHDAKLKPLNKAAADLLDHFQEYEIHHHKRGFNARADSLANLAMDSLESGSSDQL